MGGEEPQLEHAATLYCRVDTVPCVWMCLLFFASICCHCGNSFCCRACWILCNLYIVFTFDYYLKQFSTSYRNIPEDKRFYVLSNLIKSAALFAYSPLAGQLLYQTMYLDEWDSNKIRIMG